MASVVSTGTADAPFKISQADLKEFIQQLFTGSDLDVNRLISVFDNSEISDRHISVSPEWLKSDHTFKERSVLFRETAIELSKQAVIAALQSAGAAPADISNIIYVTSTGIMTPTLDALLFNELGFSKHVKRTPLWGLGCAGGAAGLSRAMEYTRAFPGENALLVALELCSLTFQRNDMTKSNIVAASLFSDGAACAVICGSDSPLMPKGRAEIIDSFSTIYSDSLDVMGWEIVESGFRVIFSRDIPVIVKELVKPNIEEFLFKHSLSIDDIAYYVTHPGGLKVINSYEESLGLERGKLDLSRKVLREHGNMSSPSVLYVLDEFLKTSPVPGKFGLLSALGPGFSSELVLFRTV
ncbi:MAG: type III polyketide synthase [Ignavibacteria bacterium]|nr:type III polyketide synthase [Ignavibacteria bacterium]